MPVSFDRFARETLTRYPLVFHTLKLVSLGNCGGFSGALIWRAEGGTFPLCLRAWPAKQSDSTRLNFLHDLMQRARAAGLLFVPTVIATADGYRHVDHAGRLWDLTEWLPGRADFHDHPSTSRLEAASTALARLHTAWEQATEPYAGICPALCRRLARAAQWQELRQSGWSLPRDTGTIDPVRSVAERAFRLIDRYVEKVPQRLQLRTNRRWPLQPCLCDVWHDHLLFEGDRLTGLIDYGAVKIDHPTVDFARMFGSLVPDNPAAWQIGLQAYRAIRPFSDEELELARALDKTGVVIGAATWLRWLYQEFRPFEDRIAVAQRLTALVERMEQWNDEQLFT